VTGSDQDAGATGGHRAHDAVGSAAEEAVKLLGVLSDWARDVNEGLHSGLEQHLATGAPECTWCPVCRTVHVVRAASPEIKGHLASAAASLMQAAAGVLAAAAAGAGSGAARSDRVETIDLDGDDGWPAEEEHERPEEDA
jgi:hypothetical protein